MPPPLLSAFEAVAAALALASLILVPEKAVNEAAFPLITLSGVSRFNYIRNVDTFKTYIKGEVDWSNYKDDDFRPSAVHGASDGVPARARRIAEGQFSRSGPMLPK